MGFFSKLIGKNNWKKTLVKDLTMLTAVDGDMDKDEVTYLYEIAVDKLGFTEQQFSDLMHNLGDVDDVYPVDQQDKLDYLQYLLQMTYADGYVDDNEVGYMKLVAKRMNLPVSAVDKAIAYLEANTEDSSVYSEFESNDDWSVDFINMYQNGHLFLSDKIQADMYNKVRVIKEVNDNFMFEQSAENIKEAFQASQSAINKSEQIVRWLEAKNISGLDSEHIVTAFYLVNLSDVSFKDADEFSDNEVRNTLATMLAFGKGEQDIDPNQLTDLTVEKVRISIKWLLAHPTN